MQESTAMRYKHVNHTNHHQMEEKSSSGIFFFFFCSHSVYYGDWGPFGLPTLTTGMESGMAVIPTIILKQINKNIIVRSSGGCGMGMRNCYTI